MNYLSYQKTNSYNIVQISSFHYTMTHYTLGIIRRKYQKHERSSGPSISKGSPGGMLKLLENASKYESLALDRCGMFNIVQEFGTTKAKHTRYGYCCR